MTPYERLDVWLAAAGDGQMVTFLVAPADIVEWIEADVRVFDPNAVGAMYRGLPVIAGPGYGVGGAA